MMKKILIAIIAISLLACTIFAQEVLDSTEERYYYFLSLTGNSKRNFLTYRTLSDSVWTVEDDLSSPKDIWAGNNLGSTKILIEDKSQNSNFFTSGIQKGIRYKLFAPQWYSSYNTASPYGVNDGALWQGKGYNTAITGGARIEGYGFELTIRPQFSYSQNREYEYMTSTSMKNGIYADKAGKYGYWWTVVDFVQRYGEDSFTKFDWGDSEIRWSWKAFTVGFGTQAVWLGPAFYSPLLSSNNAPTYPKFDFGLKRVGITLPYFNIYLGDIETRIWIGKLKESDYFDSESQNDRNQYSGFNFAYAPSFIHGLTLGVTKITVSKWGDDFWLYAYPGYNGNTLSGNSAGRVGEDQKASLYADWLFTKIGFEVYGELSFDDFLAEGFTFYAYERYPIHAIAWNWGLKKSFEVSKKHNLRGLLQFEWNWSEASQDYQMWAGSNYNFGTHGQITQGYTNGGQWIGSGYGYGGNSQTLAFTLYRKSGFDKIFIQRNNPDNNYIYSKCVSADENTTKKLADLYFTGFKANFNLGFESLFFVTKDFSIRAGFIYNKIINPMYNPGTTYGTYRREYNWIDNFQINWSLKYQFL
ncbi:hypothetical protein HRO25_08495 [Treponema pectinovorum]